MSYLIICKNLKDVESGRNRLYAADRGYIIRTDLSNGEFWGLYNDLKHAYQRVKEANDYSDSINSRVNDLRYIPVDKEVTLSTLNISTTYDIEEVRNMLILLSGYINNYGIVKFIMRESIVDEDDWWEIVPDYTFEDSKLTVETLGISVKCEEWVELD